MPIKGFVGINNRNPFNIKQANPDWDGSLGADAKNHAIFTDPVYSVRAAVRQLANYCLRDGAQTLNEIFEIYAPKSDGNEPEKYAKFVGDEAGIHPDTRLRLFESDGNISQFNQLIDILKGMLQVEICTGYELPEETLRAGIALYEHKWVR